MAPKKQKPDIEQITNRYLDAWETFGKERFTTDELETELLRQRDPEDVPSDDQIYQDLYRATKLGIIDWFGGNKYQVTISPEATKQQWGELMEKHSTWVSSEISKRVDEREKEQTEDDQLDDEPEIIEYDGQQYMSAFVGGSSDVQGQARYYQAALSPTEHDGVVLRSYQDVAGSAEKLAKKITDDDRMSKTVCVYRFEIEDMKMEDLGDDLEYRIYLNETKLL